MIILKGSVITAAGNGQIEKGAVVLDGNKIKLVCRENELPEYTNAETYSVEDATIMPGLIEGHVHLSWGSASAIGWITSTPQLAMARALRDLKYLRSQGYTSVRDMGSDAIMMKPAIAEGLLDIPRIYGAGKILTQIGGHGDAYQKLSIEASMRAYSPSVIVTGVDEVRMACRINARNGADFIKIMTTGGVFSQGDKAVSHSHFSVEEIRAAVEEAENIGSYVAAHAQANRGIKAALKNGVRTIEHGFYLDEESIELMLKNNCYLIPTLSIMHVSKLYFEKTTGVMEYLREKTLASYEAHYHSLEMARKAKVKIGMGCDFLSDAEFGCTYDKATMEFERMEYAGFSPIEIITMATKVNSEIIMMQDKVGTLEAGKLADVILVAGNPLDDIKIMCNADNVKMVIQDGRIVKNIICRGKK